MILWGKTLAWMEIDFLISRRGITNRHNVIPIEVKSGKNYTLTSLGKFTAKYGEAVGTPVVVHPGDLREAGGIRYLPLYMAPLL